MNFSKIQQTIFFIAVWVSIPQFLFSQEATQKRIDSVLETINSKPYEEKKDAYSFINDIILKDQANSQSLFNYALSKDSTSIGKMVIYSKYSQRLSQQGKTDDALKIRLEGLALAEKLKDETAIMEYHSNIGNTYLYQNKLDKSLYHLNLAEQIAEKPDQRDYLWNVYYSKALLQGLLKDDEAAKMYYRKMYDAIKDYENNTHKRFALYILVDYFSQIDEPEALAKFTEELSSLYEEANPNTPAGHMPIKAIFEKRADPSNLPRLKEAIRISDSLNSINSHCYTTIALAETYSKMKQPQLAIPFLENALKKLETVNKPQVKLEVLSKMASIQLEAKNNLNAYQYKMLEVQIKDSISSERMQRNIAELEVKFDTEKKERKILEQNLTIEKESRQKNQILYGLVGLGGLLLVSFIFFQKRLKDQKTIAAQKLAIQNQEITELQQKNKLLALNSMIEGQEAERLRIAKDLHDSLGGLLSTVKAHFTTIQKEIEQLEKLNITEKTNSLIDEACIEVRRISHNMMPHALSISGLQGAIEDIAESLRDEGYTTTLEISNLPKNADTTKEVMIYRLLQEIISNIRKHAQAKTILIQLIGYKNELTLIIEDDGHGFDYEKAVEKDGLGLKSINSRVQYLDGTISWDSQPGKGTSITINIPVS
ncbi:MAG: sensor histidine kinase [Flavobacteriaceae bacterium]|nr:sensor histidine kinase [Flavobacteriaceae bacterium]